MEEPKWIQDDKEGHLPLNLKFALLLLENDINPGFTVLSSSC